MVDDKVISAADSGFPSQNTDINGIGGRSDDFQSEYDQNPGLVDIVEGENGYFQSTFDGRKVD